MTADIAIGLLLQLIALIVVRWQLGRRWASHIGALFLLFAVIYHGVGQIFILLFPGEDPYLPLLGPGTMSSFTLLVSGAILVFAVVYATAVGAPGPSVSTNPASLTEVVRFFDWRLMVLLAIPLVILTATGHGYDSTTTGAVQTNATGLTQQFLLLVVPLASFAVVGRFGRRALLPVLLVQSAVLATIGERLEVVVGGLLLLFMLARYGIRLSRRQVAIGGILLLVAGLGVTAARAQVGRSALGGSNGASARVKSTITGFGHVFTSATWQQIRQDLGYRLDGNSWGAMQLGAFRSGSPTLGTAELGANWNAVVPHFLNKTKDTGDPASDNDLVLAEERLNLPQVGVLPTQLGVTYGYFGDVSLYGAAALFGLGFAIADRWLRPRRGPASLIVAASLLYSAAFYERSVDVYLLTLRGALVVLAIVGAFQFARKTVSPPPRSRAVVLPTTIDGGPPGAAQRWSSVRASMSCRNDAWSGVELDHTPAPSGRLHGRDHAP